MRRKHTNNASENRSSPGVRRTAPEWSREPTNTARAAWAKEALAVFTATTFSGDHPDSMDRDDLECAIADLICDLMHYARRRAFAPTAILRQACGNYADELREEEVHP